MKTHRPVRRIKTGRSRPGRALSSRAVAAPPPAAARLPQPLRLARELIELPPAIQKLLEAGKLEQTCRACGRWEAAGFYCTWCAATIDHADWYWNGAADERAARMPKTAPENPPSEYLNSLRDWPAAWGPYPRRVRGPRALGAPAEGVSECEAEPMATPPVQLALAVSL
jgi:hypothetical protein